MQLAQTVVIGSGSSQLKLVFDFQINRINRFRTTDEDDDDDDVIVLKEIPINMKRERKCCNLK